MDMAGAVVETVEWWEIATNSRRIRYYHGSATVKVIFIFFAFMGSVYI
jgi:hypothetical protein